HDTACGTYLTILSPLVPILYADKVIDGMMKGYDKQMSTLKINLIDSAFRTVAALLILPKMGINGYIAILYVGSTLNFLLSYFALRRTCGLRFPVREGILRGGLAALASMLPLKIAEKLCGITIPLALGTSILLFLLFLNGLSTAGSHGKHQKLIGKHTSG
ncbi:MAG: polysaccharide biosynthesis C-terminal domain-containing protein, partial [Clostridia bacterium]|nr:polysaccharide biosynthesis C-terminal domain-containing protein [Clostridia bacterium]